jgi:hypothetical protein
MGGDLNAKAKCLQWAAQEVLQGAAIAGPQGSKSQHRAVAQKQVAGKIRQ